LPEFGACFRLATTGGIVRVTKFEHSCLQIEDGGRRCFIDPGKFTTPITDAAQVDLVAITHEHDDHWTPEQLRRLAERSPGLTVVTTPATAAKIHEAEIEGIRNVIIGKPGATYEVGAFKIACYGGKHAEIHSSIPIIDNLGVVINGQLAYGGDAYDLPAGEIAALAVPAYGPWMRMAESMDLLATVKPKRAFAVHEMLLAMPGKQLAAARFAEVAEHVGTEFLDLAPYDSVTI
jgi:L-ascorbate metabolism protein UlaG (beta-lactamase superfamily)